MLEFIGVAIRVAKTTAMNIVGLLIFSTGLQNCCINMLISLGLMLLTYSRTATTESTASGHADLPTDDVNKTRSTVAAF